MNELTETETEVEITRCGNCGAALSGKFCFDCGQEDRIVRRPFWRILRQLLHAVFELDGRVYRSLFFLYTHPGFLSTEYLSGRRARYTPPLRMFLVLSISFFLLVSVVGNLLNPGANEDPASAADAGRDILGLQASDRPIQDFLGGDAEDEEFDIDPQEIVAALREIELPFLPTAVEERLKNLVIDQLTTNYSEMRENPLEFFRDFFSESLEYVTIFILLMMPLLALVQWALYLFKGRYYIEHFILTLHNHSYLIVSSFLLAITGFIAGLLPPLATFFGWIDFAIILWAIVYLYLSLKNFYRSSYFYSGLVYLSASLIYGALLTAGLAIFLVIAFLLY